MGKIKHTNQSISQKEKCSNSVVEFIKTQRRKNYIEVPMADFIGPETF